jgi:hypothetical protein
MTIWNTYELCLYLSNLALTTMRLDFEPGQQCLYENLGSSNVAIRDSSPQETTLAIGHGSESSKLNPRSVHVAIRLQGVIVEGLHSLWRAISWEVDLPDVEGDIPGRGSSSTNDDAPYVQSDRQWYRSVQRYYRVACGGVHQHTTLPLSGEGSPT